MATTASTSGNSANKKKRALVCFSVDIDAVAGWLGSYGGENSTSDISRGVFAGTVGIQRLLKLFRKYNITTTWFIPGHSLETFPDECALVRDAGHEIGLHGYSHENPNAMSLQQQTDVMDRCYRLLTDFCGGKPPRGIVAPWWECSREGAELMLRYGVEYDHSFSHHDCQSYFLRTGDTWTNVDLKKEAKEWMFPLKKGQETGLVEIPSNWNGELLGEFAKAGKKPTDCLHFLIRILDDILQQYLDDLPPMMFNKNAASTHGWVDTSTVEHLWRDHFDYFYREYDDFIFPVTIHPDVSGHPHVILMLERLFDHINSHEGVEWVTMEYIADDFKSRNTPVKGALLPAQHGAVLNDRNLKLSVQP